MRSAKWVTIPAKSVLAGALILFLTAIVAGSGTFAQAQAQRITVLSVEDPFYFALRELLPEFEAKTGIQVDLQAVAYHALNARATNAFMRREPGIDVMTIDNIWLSQWAENGWIRVLDDLIARDNEEVRLEDFIPAALYSLNIWMGHFYALPIAAYGQFVMYQPHVLEALGLRLPPSSPDEPADWWTWETYVDYVKKIHGQVIDGVTMYGTVISGAQPQPIVHMFSQLAASMGARWFKQFPEGEWDFTPTLNSEENVRALERWLELYKHSPPESINYIWFDAGVRFGQGDIGMFFWWTPYAYLVRQAGYMVDEPSNVAGRYAIAPLPHEPGYENVTSFGGWSLAINQYSDRLEAAWEFVKWATSEETQRKMGLIKPYQFSDFARKSIYENPGELLEHYPWMDIEYRIKQVANGKVVRPTIPVYVQVEGLYGLELNRVLAGHVSPRQALNNVQTQVEVMLTNSGLIPWLRDSYDDTLENTIRLIESLTQ